MAQDTQILNYLRAQVNHSDTPHLFKKLGVKIYLQQGEYFCTQISLQKNLGLTRSQVRTFLKNHEGKSFTSRTVKNRWSRVVGTVIKFDLTIANEKTRLNTHFHDISPTQLTNESINYRLKQQATIIDTQSKAIQKQDKLIKQLLEEKREIKEKQDIIVEKRIQAFLESLPNISNGKPKKAFIIDPEHTEHYNLIRSKLSSFHLSTYEINGIWIKYHTQFQRLLDCIEYTEYKARMGSVQHKAQYLQSALKNNWDLSQLYNQRDKEKEEERREQERIRKRQDELIQEEMDQQEREQAYKQVQREKELIAQFFNKHQNKKYIDKILNLEVLPIHFQKRVIAQSKILGITAEEYIYSSRIIPILKCTGLYKKVLIEAQKKPPFDTRKDTNEGGIMIPFGKLWDNRQLFIFKQENSAHTKGLNGMWTQSRLAHSTITSNVKRKILGPARITSKATAINKLSKNPQIQKINQNPSKNTSQTTTCSLRGAQKSNSQNFHPINPLNITKSDETSYDAHYTKLEESNKYFTIFMSKKKSKDFLTESQENAIALASNQLQNISAIATQANIPEVKAISGVEMLSVKTPPLASILSTEIQNISDSLYATIKPLEKTLLGVVSQESLLSKIVDSQLASINSVVGNFVSDSSNIFKKFREPLDVYNKYKYIPHPGQSHEVDTFLRSALKDGLDQTEVDEWIYKKYSENNWSVLESLKEINRIPDSKNAEHISLIVEDLRNAKNPHISMLHTIVGHINGFVILISEIAEIEKIVSGKSKKDGELRREVLEILNSSSGIQNALGISMFRDVLYQRSNLGEDLQPDTFEFSRHKIVHTERLDGFTKANFIRAIMILDFIIHITIEIYDHVSNSNGNAAPPLSTSSGVPKVPNQGCLQPR